MSHIAAFVIGHSPAIITETLAASMDAQPDMIRVCTTLSGARLLSRVAGVPGHAGTGAGILAANRRGNMAAPACGPA